MPIAGNLFPKDLRVNINNQEFEYFSVGCRQNCEKVGGKRVFVAV